MLCAILQVLGQCHRHDTCSIAATTKLSAVGLVKCLKADHEMYVSANGVLG